MISEVDQLDNAEQGSPGEDETARFEQSLLPHLAAAYNLARWLTGDHHDAEDLVQEAYLRAFKAFKSFRGEDGRAWLLTIVRNTAYTRFERSRQDQHSAVFDEEIHGQADEGGNPETFLIQEAGNKLVREAIEELPVEFREVVVLREFEGLSYKEIASVTHLRIGTVMSRLARARDRLRENLLNTMTRESALHRTGCGETP